MPKAHWKSNVDEEDDVPLHGATNEEEAKLYSSTLDDIVFQMGVSIKDEKVDAIKEVIKKYKDAIANMFPNMAAANTDAVFPSVKDKVGLCLCPQTEQKENVLESIISAEEVTSAAEVLGKVEEIRQEERDLIKELFDSRGGTLTLSHSVQYFELTFEHHETRKPKDDTERQHKATNRDKNDHGMEIT